MFIQTKYNINDKLKVPNITKKLEVIGITMKNARGRVETFYSFKGTDDVFDEKLLEEENVK